MELNKTLHQSITALKEGKFQEAERLYSKILQIYPAHPEANHYLGVTLYILGKLNQATKNHYFLNQTIRNHITTSVLHSKSLISLWKLKKVTKKH